MQIYEKLVFHFGFFQPATLFFSSFSKGSQTGSTNLVENLVTRGSGNLPTKYLVKITLKKSKISAKISCLLAGDPHLFVPLSHLGGRLLAKVRH